MGTKKKKVVPTGPRTDKGPDKASVKTRVDCSATVGQKAPKSSLWTSNQPLQDAGNALIAAGTDLGTANTTHNEAFLTLSAARTTLVTKTAAWDHAYGVFVTNAEKVAVNPEDLANLGLHPLTRNVYPFGEPLAVVLKFDPRLRLVRIHVKLPPGLDVCEIEVSPDPITATSWKRLVGHGVLREINNPAPGTYWVHAASVRATEQSAFTAPVSIVVT